MFEHVGSKIKGFAVALFWINIILSVIIGFGVNFGVGILIILLGPPLFWFYSLMVRGFGQLIENSDVRTQLAIDESRTKKER